MDDHIVAISGVGHDGLKALHHREARPQHMTEAAVMTTALVAMRFCGGHCAQARALRGTGHYLPTMRSRRRWKRRLSQLQHLCATLLDL
jgi:hypothetical protein